MGELLDLPKAEETRTSLNRVHGSQHLLDTMASIVAGRSFQPE
jgi:hypothetical protein